MANVPDELAEGEYLWRGVFDRRRSRRQKVRYNEFLESRGNLAISVNRLDYADEAEKQRIAELISSDTRTWRRWACVSLEDVLECNRKVEPEKLSDNEYHANILLPEGSDFSAQKVHADRLAKRASWDKPPSIL